MRGRKHGGRLVLVLVGVVAGGMIGPAAQEPGVVRGRVEIGIPVASRRPTTAYPTRSIPAPKLAPETERRNVIVYVRDARPQNVTPIRAVIRQHNETFTPRVVAVTLGSEVDFPNDDPIYHNVFSLSRAKNFNLGRYPRGETRRVRFDKPGVVKVYCDIHSNMEGFIVVVPNTWFARAADDGTFELPPVPAGSYRVQLWHPDLGSRTLSVNVAEDETRSVEVSF